VRSPAWPAPFANARATWRPATTEPRNVYLRHYSGLRDIGATLGITERTAFGIVTDLTDAGYIVKNKDGNRNRYRIQHHLPLRGGVGQERTIGEVLQLLVDTSSRVRTPPKP
jgi:hypothetical protein